MTKKKIYIAGPYSTGDVAINVRKAMDAWEELFNLGYAPFIPHTSHFIHMVHEHPYLEWLDYDNEWVPVCNVLLRIPGKSSGADKEVELAKSLGIPVFYSIEELHKYFLKKDILEFRGPTRWLSNFHEAPVFYEGIIYPTSEHAYQAAKSDNKKVRKKIASLKTAREAKIEGRKIVPPNNWHEISLGIMEEINYVKFTRHFDLCLKLLETEDVHLEEGNNWGDRFWGTVDGIGENHLGKILMKIRNRIKENN